MLHIYTVAGIALSVIKYKQLIMVIKKHTGTTNNDSHKNMESYKNLLLSI